MLKISAATATSVLEDLKESHISVWLCVCGEQGGREGGRKRERTSKSERDERRPQLVVGVGEQARKGKKGERERETERAERLKK